MLDRLNYPKINEVEIHSQINELYAKTTVTQKALNESDNPKELQIIVYKHPTIIFSSFLVKIGDSITVKSKVKKKEKAEEKYTDSISSGNGAIFVSDDPENPNRIIINVGNIPPKQELLFISEYIHFTELSDNYEFELFRNIPLLSFNDSIERNFDIKGLVEIKTKNKIKNIEKKILSNDLKILEEKYNDENHYEYFIKYEGNSIYKIRNRYKQFLEKKYKYNYDKIESYYEYEYIDDYLNNENYIPSCKIYFITENDEPIAFYQESSLKENEYSYIIQYKNNKNELDIKNNDILNPAIFIFLLDQSASMSGESIKVASKALILFLQSLPVNSYYQIIGFGTHFIKYDHEPIEYTQENVKETIAFLETLDGDLGGTDIYSPLKEIFDSSKIYKK